MKKPDSSSVVIVKWSKNPFMFSLSFIYFYYTEEKVCSVLLLYFFLIDMQWTVINQTCESIEMLKCCPQLFCFKLSARHLVKVYYEMDYLSKNCINHLYYSHV